MNSIGAILFVVAGTILGKWLLFDDDTPREESEDILRLRIADTPGNPDSPPMSKSA